MSANLRSVERFIKKQHNTIMEVGGLSRLQLFQASAGRPATKLDQWLFTEDHGCRPEEVAVEIIDAASSDAQVASGQQRYLLRAYFGAQEEHSAQHSFAVGQLKSVDDCDTTEPPTVTGQRQQMMRQTENLHVIVLNAMRGLTDGLREDARAQREQAQATQNAYFTLLEENRKLRAADREDERQQAELTMQREEQDFLREQRTTVMNLLMSMAPAVLAKFTGARQVNPTSEAEMRIKAFMESLSEKETQAVLAALNDGNKVQLLQLASLLQDPPPQTH
jgi:hypothetical protein